MTKEQAYDKLSKKLDKLTKDYAIDPKPSLAINTRLKTTAGILSVKHKKGKTTNLSIELNQAYLKEFGYKRLERTFYHEFAHAIAWIHYGEIGHTKKFKEICKKLGGSLSLAMGGQETKWLIEPFRWLYTCPLCGNNFKRKRKFNLKNRKRYKCVNCLTPFTKFSEVKLSTSAKN